jgi:thioredoxin 2
MASSQQSITVACPHCHMLNRSPRNGVAKAAEAASATSRCSPGYPVNLDSAHFDGHAGAAGRFLGGLVRPCRAMAPVFESAEREFELPAWLVERNLQT